MKEKILIIEDDFTIQTQLKTLLSGNGYEVVAVTDFSQTIEQLKEAAPHLVILDIKLPGNNGFEICSGIRTFSDIPIVFVTSSNTDMDELNSIMLGGDAFITKPYNPAILLAKIAALLKKAYRSPQTEIYMWREATLHLESIIDKVVRQIFERMKAIPKSEIVNIRYREKMEERKTLLKSAKSDYAKAAAELDTLRAEVIKSLRGESAFSQDLLGSLISDCETKCLEVQHTMEAAQAAYDEGQAMLDALNAQYDDIISWADMYDSASMESKKMIVSCLIRRVEVYRDYRLHIDFNIDFEQFSAGLDISAIAA